MGPSSRSGAACLALGAVLLLGCVSSIPAPPPETYVYFSAAAPDDPWTAKIAAWQSRARAPGAPAPHPALASVSGGGASDSTARSEDLRAKYRSYRVERKRTMARELAAWIQEQATHHYRPDGPLDRWATLDETLDANGDDCDGLELLVYHFLRDLGFGADEVYRAIVYRPEDGQHHMVTFWFERPEDPWVIDPTGAMTRGMPRMSEVHGWVPLKLFTGSEEYSVRRRPPEPSAQTAAFPLLAPR